MSSLINVTPQSHSQKRKGGRAPLPEVEENFTRLPPGPGDRTERAVCKHCQKERSWHTTELVKHLDKCAQYTPSKRQKYTRPWRIEQPGNARSPNQPRPQSQQPSPQQLHFDPANRNARVPHNAVFQWDGPVVAGRPLTTNNSDPRPGEDNHHVDVLQDRDQQPQPQPQPQQRPQQQQQQQQHPNHHTLHTPQQSLGGSTDYTNTHTPNFAPRPPPQLQPPSSTPSTCPPPVNDPDPRLHSFIEYERGATAWQSRPEDLDAIEAWLQHHRIDIEDIKEITDTRWVDSWLLKLGDLYRIKRDVQTFKVFATR